MPKTEEVFFLCPSGSLYEEYSMDPAARRPERTGRVYRPAEHGEQPDASYYTPADFYTHPLVLVKGRQR